MQGLVNWTRICLYITDSVHILSCEIGPNCCCILRAACLYVYPLKSRALLKMNVCVQSRQVMFGICTLTSCKLLYIAVGSIHTSSTNVSPGLKHKVICRSERKMPHSVWQLTTSAYTRQNVAFPLADLQIMIIIIYYGHLARLTHNGPKK